MRKKQFIYGVLLVFFTLIGLWGIPELVKTASLSGNRYPFVYFSSVEKKFLFRELDGRKEPFHDDEGKIYTDKEYDAALPLFNFRQLTINGEMPDSIDGIAVDPRLLRVKQVNFRYSPIEKNTPEIGLYIMYESLPKKAKLESPGDVFRLKESIEFVDAETNTVNREKSERFQSAMLKAGYVFPAQWTYGNLNIRKPYDEGYFSLDAQGKLYHIKMVNGRPFVRDTQLNDSIEPAFFSMLEVADKRFYGFLFDKKGYAYILEEKGGKYNALPMDIAPFDLDKDELMIMGNFLYWTVSVQTNAGKHFYALDTETLKQRRYFYQEATVNQWDVLAKRLFPVYLTFKDVDKHSEFLAPRLHFTAYSALWVNVLLSLLAVFVFPHRNSRKRISGSIYTLVSGIAGIVALFIMEITSQSHNNKHL
ncbi:MAG: DUF4857 domain-containing protein [Dysgonamonadaceae bacterium]|jgi:hypothetical protein|nr:DUF4857 domain-containing protein [Dysgonamonadaceae bacterium]